MMLHHQDDSMLLLNPSENHRIYRMDLNLGDIVEEWKTGTGYPVKDIFPETKTAQVQPVQTLIALHSQGLFKVDPRLPSEKQVASQKVSYSAGTQPQLQCGVTTGEGHLAIGSAKGQIRFFNKAVSIIPRDELSRANAAKTMLPGFGDGIFGIDVTEDGEWVLATSRTYLLLIPTKIEDSTGFEKRMGKNKPIPRRLQLTSHHLKEMGGKVNFTTARFNTGTHNERSIVTSSANYIITWNFRKVKQNQLYSYTIKKMDDVVIADQFKYGEDQSIVVAMPHQVIVEKRVPKK